MGQIIDRRLNGKYKSAVNRERFIERYKTHIKHAVADAINKRRITDIDSSEKVTIPTKDLQEPNFHYGSGGHREIVLPGNKEFKTGDRINKNNSVNGEGKGNQASDTGEGLDEFVFTLSREEFLNIYFEDLALPDLVKKQLQSIVTQKTVRAGYTTEGNPTTINIVRSLKSALGRRIAMTNKHKKYLHELLEKLANLHENEIIEKKNLEAEIEKTKLLISKTPFIDTFDLRYNNRVKQDIPTTSAVMFCIMDVSGSMDKVKKDLAKRFFILLYLFLKKNYKKIDLVFIRHHTSAKEVDEEDFFYSRETGGTVVSSSLHLLKNIIKDRYNPTQWNIYVAQASDGDNWNADSPHCYQVLHDEIIQNVQYFAYVEIMPRLHQSLWEAYEKIQQEHPNFAMRSIQAHEDIFPVFKDLFKADRS